MKIAVIGSGISGLSSAYYLSKKHKVDLFEKQDRFGGHSYTLDVKLNEKEKATATLTYLKYEKMKDEMQKLEMHGGPDDYLENLEKIKKEVALWLIQNEKYPKRVATNAERTTRRLAHRLQFAQQLARRIYTTVRTGMKVNCITEAKC